jgi:hypothetical protein
MWSRDDGTRGVNASASAISQRTKQAHDALGGDPDPRLHAAWMLLQPIALIPIWVDLPWFHRRFSGIDFRQIN